MKKMSHITTQTGVGSVAISVTESFDSSASFLYDNSSYLANADNTSNFLVNVDSFIAEKNAETSSRSVLKESRNIISEEPRVKIKNVELVVPNYLYEYGTNHSSFMKENMVEDADFKLSDLLSKMGPPTSILKKSNKPSMPMIMELSHEDSRVSSSISMVSSARSDSYMDLNTNTIDLPIFVSSLSNPDIPQPKANKTTSQTSNVTRQSGNDDSYFSAAGITTSSIAPLDCLDSVAQIEGTYVDEEGNANFWNEFNEEINKSLAVAPVRFVDLNATQNGLKFDDAGFQSFTEEEAKELMDKEEAERLQFITSQIDDTMSGRLLSGSGTSFDKDISMGAYFGKRSSNPFKFKANDSSMFTDKSYETIRTSFREYERPESVIANRSLASTSQGITVKHNITAKFENEEFMPPKPADTSLDSLGKFFMGPDSDYLSGNPKGMMEYIIDHCKKVSEEKKRRKAEENSVTELPGAKIEKIMINKSSDASTSSSGSTGVSSLNTTKTLTPNNSGVKRSLDGDFKSCKPSQQEEEDTSESKHNSSVVVANYGTVSKINDTALFDASLNTSSNMYAKFKNDLVQACRQSDTSMDSSKLLAVKQDRFWELENNVQQKEVLKYLTEFLADNPKPVTQSTNTTQRSLEMLRKHSSSPPERLGSVFDCNKNSSDSRVAHSTPLQQLSMSQTMAKQLGMGSGQSKSDWSGPGNSKLEIVEDSSKGTFLAKYNFADKNKVTDHVPNKIREPKASETKPKLQDKSSLTENPSRNVRKSSYGHESEMDQKHPASKHKPIGVSKTTVSAQTSFKDSGPTEGVPHNHNNQIFNTIPVTQPQGLGFPLIIQIHCACSGNVNVISSQQQSASAIPVNITPQPQLSIQQQQAEKPLCGAHGGGNKNNAQPTVKQSQDVSTHSESSISEHDKSKAIASIEVEKLGLGWGCVKIGTTETNTVRINNKERVECRFRAIICETSPIKNFKFVLDSSDPRIKVYERIGILPPMGSALLKVNFSPQKSGPTSGFIKLIFHTIPKDIGFKSEIPLVAYGGDGFLHLQRPITDTALYILSLKKTGIIDFSVENTQSVPLYVGVVITDKNNVKLPSSSVKADPEEFLLAGENTKEIKLRFAHPFRLLDFKVYLLWIEDISRLRYIRSINGPDRIRNKTKTPTFNNEVVRKLLNGLSYEQFKKEMCSGVELTTFRPTQDDSNLLHNFRFTVMDLKAPDAPVVDELRCPSSIGFTLSADNNASFNYSSVLDDTYADACRSDHTKSDLQLDFMEKMFKAQSSSTRPLNDGTEGRAGDAIKVLNNAFAIFLTLKSFIQNKDINFSKVSVGKCSRKIVYITNNGLTSARFIVQPKTKYEYPYSSHIVNQFTTSASEGTIDRSATKEIVFTFKPIYSGIHHVTWKLEVSFMHNGLLLKKYTDVTLQGECVN